MQGSLTISDFFGTNIYIEHTTRTGPTMFQNCLQVKRMVYLDKVINCEIHWILNFDDGNLMEVKAIKMMRDVLKKSFLCQQVTSVAILIQNK